MMLPLNMQLNKLSIVVVVVDSVETSVKVEDSVEISVVVLNSVLRSNIVEVSVSSSVVKDVTVSVSVVVVNSVSICRASMLLEVESLLEEGALVTIVVLSDGTEEIVGVTGRTLRNQNTLIKLINSY